MQTTDPIADLLTRIRNGQSAGHEVIAVPASKVKIAITHILRDEGFIRNYKCIRDSKQGILKIALKYRDDGRGVIQSLKRESRSSRRLYVKSGEIPYVKYGFGTAILSTSKGVMSDREARLQKVGGEFLCSVF